MILLGEDPYESSRLLIVEEDDFPVYPYASAFIGPAGFLGSQPQFVITRSLAEEILTGSGTTFQNWKKLHPAHRSIHSGLDLELKVVYGMAYDYALGANVIGYIPGSDARIQTHRILVVADYTGPAVLEGDTYPGADENASGVAVMLEVLRLWNEQDFVPKRTVVFYGRIRGGC